MGAFDKIIGYESVKDELNKICDMVHNKDRYEKLGARLPKGVLFAGNPGLGKTIMAKALIKETGLPSFSLRRSKGGDEFVDLITEAFEKAKEKAPSIVFLDDMDKFGNEDGRHTDCEEFVAVQAAMDESQNEGVLVVATVNEKHKLPDSLIRPGRFDWQLNLHPPIGNDSKAIIEYYLSKKALSKDINFDDINKMFTYKSCAELEALVNEAAIHAGYEQKKELDMDDFVFAVLRHTYNSPETLHSVNDYEKKKRAIHEAGHTVVSELLQPGSVGLTSIRCRGGRGSGGFMHTCKNPKDYKQSVMVGLAGKCAVELFLSNTTESGATSDLKNTIEILREQLEDHGGFGSATLEVCGYSTSNSYKVGEEAIIHTELERYSSIVKDLLLKNRAFLDRIVDAMLKKETLLHSDIQRIRKEVFKPAQKAKNIKTAEKPSPNCWSIFIDQSKSVRYRSQTKENQYRNCEYLARDNFKDAKDYFCEKVLEYDFDGVLRDFWDRMEDWEYAVGESDVDSILKDFIHDIELEIHANGNEISGEAYLDTPDNGWETFVFRYLDSKFRFSISTNSFEMGNPRDKYFFQVERENEHTGRWEPYFYMQLLPAE